MAAPLNPVISQQGARSSYQEGNSWLEELAYRPSLPASVLFPIGAAVTKRPTYAATARDCSVFSLPNGATTGGVTTWLSSPLWVNGTLYLRMLYTGDTSSTANIAVAYALVPTIETFGIAGSVVTQSTTVPGPSAAGATLDYTFTTGAAVNASHKVIGVKILRLDPDDYAGELHIDNLQLIYRPNL